MPFTLDTFTKLRPYLYHLTARANLPFLCAERRLQSATDLLRSAGREPASRIKRGEMLAIAIGEYTIILRDQAPLYSGNVALQDGWIFDDLLADLNRRVYFWPGTSNGPIDYGRRHFARYAAPGHPYDSIILRFPTTSLLTANPDQSPHFCPYNSGSPRFSGGLPSPRGLTTFRTANEFPRSASDVVEITFVGNIALPTDTAFLPLTPDTVTDNRINGTWSPLFSAFS